MLSRKRMNYGILIDLSSYGGVLDEDDGSLFRLSLGLCFFGVWVGFTGLLARHICFQTSCQFAMCAFSLM